MQMHRMALVRSINTNENDHGLGRYLMETGRRKSPAADYPHLGAVTAKALTVEASPLPGHIHVSSGAGSRRNDSAYLGPKYASIVVGADGGLRNSGLPSGMTATVDQQRHAWRRRVNERFLQRRRTAETDAYTESFEQAIQLMQRKDIFDVSQEPDSMLEKYGKHFFVVRLLKESGDALSSADAKYVSIPSR